ncbi:MAG TPA: hypothetical protein ENH06_00925 [bacterium]|nr:hypothetical protein [bacterium]
MNKRILSILLIIPIFLTLSATSVLAQGNEECQTDCAPGEICIDNPLNSCSFEGLIFGIIDFIFTISLVLVPIMIVIGGFYFVTSMGDPKKFETGRKIIFYSLIGFVVILMSKGIISMLRNIFGIK